MSNKSKLDISKDIEQGYQGDVINAKAIAWFGIVLTIVITVCFALVWFFQYRILEPMKVKIDKEESIPMGLTEAEKLPPEPRLQAAPGFGIEGKNGWISLELMPPQSEWVVFKQQSQDLLQNGEKNGNTVIALPIDQAKQQLLGSGMLKGDDSKEAQAAQKDAQTFVSDASAGRLEAETIR